MKGTRTIPTRARPMTPTTTAPANPAAVTATRALLGIVVLRGRPWSSSMAWAATPTARKKAMRVATSRDVSTRGARQAPMTT